MRSSGRTGFTLAEVLVALAVIGIAFAGLSLVQVTNLQASTTARLATDVKTAANRELERQTARVLERSGGLFVFNGFYWSCPDLPNGVFNLDDPSLGLGPLDSRVLVTDCDNLLNPRQVGDVHVTYTIYGLTGMTGEGVIGVSVTAAHRRNSNIQLTIGDRISCYDVFPTPRSDAPEPCPNPTLNAYRVEVP